MRLLIRTGRLYASVFSALEKTFAFCSSSAMSERHLPKGSALPEVKPDLMRIYSMRYCPYAERTRLVLDHKGIPYETVNVNLVNKPDWLFERNPAGLVPVLEYKGHYISESAICDEFLEEEFPNAGPNPLLPSCPFERAAARLFMQRYDKKKNVILLLRARKGDAEKFQKEFDDYLAGIQDLENHLANSGETFFAGKHVGMVDLHMWPFFERVPAICELLEIDLFPVEKYPLLNKWINAMEETDAVKKARVTNEFHKRFIVSYLEGSPQYDLELD